MSVAHALYDFLTSSETLADASRQTAKEKIRSIIGNRIWGGRRPQLKQLPAITIGRGGGSQLTTLGAMPSTQQPEIEFTIWTRDTPSDVDKSETVYAAMKQLLHQYRGALNDTITAQTITLQAEGFDREFAPVDASGEWIKGKSFTFLVGCNEVGV